MRSHKWERLNIARMNRIDGVVKMFDELGRCYLFMIIPNRLIAWQAYLSIEPTPAQLGSQAEGDPVECTQSTSLRLANGNSNANTRWVWCCI